MGLAEAGYEAFCLQFRAATTLRIGASGAKFDAEADFEPNFVVNPPKRSENCKN